MGPMGVMGFAVEASRTYPLGKTGLQEFCIVWLRDVVCGYSAQPNYHITRSQPMLYPTSDFGLKNNPTQIGSENMDFSRKPTVS
jgi:hypothetical protein